MEMKQIRDGFAESFMRGLKHFGADVLVPRFIVWVLALSSIRHRDAAWACFAVVSLAALYLAQYLDDIWPF